MGTIFISYSQHDRAAAEALCRGLDAAGLACWIAPRDIPPGKEWAGEIIEAIRACEAFVLVFSKIACDSKHILRELDQADSAWKPIFPFRIQDAQPDKSFAYYLSVVQWFDAFPGGVESHVKSFAEEIRAGLAKGIDPSRKRRKQPGMLQRHARSAVMAAVLLAAGAAIFAWARGSQPVGDIKAQALANPEVQRRVQENALASFKPIAHPKPGESWTNSLGMRFVPVKNLLICAHKTRLQDFTTFVAETSYDATAHVHSPPPPDWKEKGDNWRHPSFDQGPTEPVVGMNFFDGMAFCKWLTEREQTAGYLAAGQTYRLPTDVEWSIAVGLPEEKGKTPKDKQDDIPNIYPWGSQWPPPPTAGNYAGSEAWDDGSAPVDTPTIAGYRDSFRRTSPPGAFPANKFGLYDMGGNAWEWTMDEFNPDAEGDEAKRKALRGGGWQTDGSNNKLLASHRHAAPPESRYTSASFRCVLVVDENK